ncbi:MAG: branched-chain amino acid ABC transporter substrate-binding protein, partial [Burkholderiaceae bacterium]|nr:branched-chain amino acid ABC transporter substrate-binding protein [Burkholderiaceae bacterium]
MFQRARRALLGGALLACRPVWARGQTTAPPVKLALIESLSGPFANAGEAAWRNLLWAVERINARGGVRTAQGARSLELLRFDNKGQAEESLLMLRAAIDAGCVAVMQGNSSAVAAALIDAIDKHNQRDPARRVLFLNYAAVDPMLTNERCSFWHFRFDAHADMRIAALMEVIVGDTQLKSIYLIGQDYSFGHAVLREARRQLAARRPDVAIAAEELHPMGRVKDFLPYAVKIKASGAQAVLTGNWGNDLTLLVKAAREAGFGGRFYTFYGNALGAPAAIGEAGVGRVLAVADWMPNVPTPESAALYRAFRRRFPDPRDDYVHLRMLLLVEALAQAVESAGSADPLAVAHALENARVTLAGRTGVMRLADHQFQQPLVVGMMERQGTPGV